MVLRKDSMQSRISWPVLWVLLTQSLTEYSLTEDILRLGKYVVQLVGKVNQLRMVIIFHFLLNDVDRNGVKSNARRADGNHKAKQKDD